MTRKDRKYLRKWKREQRRHWPYSDLTLWQFIKMLFGRKR